MRKTMSMKLIATAALISAAAAAAPAMAEEQFIPSLVYRTGPYAPNGVPVANGMNDYYALVNERDGGVNGIMLKTEECETGYSTDRIVECYERLKNEGAKGASFVHPFSTGGTFALTDKTTIDKIPIITAGYGRSESANGETFKWNFPLGGSYWVAADILVQHLKEKMGGKGSLKGKKIALVYHDSPYGKEPITILDELSKIEGYEFQKIPVTHPGVEQKAAWLQIRRSRPDAVFLWGWGVMNSTAIKEAVATGYPREKMYGVWWSGAEPDVVPAGDGAKGYNALSFLMPSGKAKAHEDIMKYVHAKGKNTGPADEVGQVLYNRGVASALLGVEAIRAAQGKFGKRALSGEEVRWGLENLNIDAKRIEELGLSGLMYEVSTSCKDHMGANTAQVSTWNGKSWDVNDKIYKADMQILKPIQDKTAAAYAKEKNLTVRDCAKELS
ncbi:MAG: ABC transporter substrate-binding protein [Burkholderiaceae bacterium]